jgi:glycosyl transferase family 25
MQSLKTYVVNLDGSADRLEAISARLDAFDVDFERVPAFDGRKLDMSTLDEYDAGRARRYMGRDLVGGEIGCYRSHLAVASRFLNSNARYALVLEDDAFPLCNPVKLLTQALPDLDSLDPDWILINIGNNKQKITTSVKTYRVDGHECDLVAAHYFPMTTSAIVWSRKGAASFVDGHGKIFAPVDNFFRHWLTREGHGYSFWPAPVTTTDAASQILAASGQARKKNQRKWYYGFSKQKRLLEDKIIAMKKRKKFRYQIAKLPISE